MSAKQELIPNNLLILFLEFGSWILGVELHIVIHGGCLRRFRWSSSSVVEGEGAGPKKLEEKIF